MPHAWTRFSRSGASEPHPEVRLRSSLLAAKRRIGNRWSPSAIPVASLRKRFTELHAAGIFVMPNAWDIGSARILESLGFPAIATTSSGHAASLGRINQHVTPDELLAHVEALVQAVELPVSVDAERCFADEPEGVAATVARIAETGAAGVSIEDYTPGALAFAAYGALAAAGRELLSKGTSSYASGSLSQTDRESAFHDTERDQ